MKKYIDKLIKERYAYCIFFTVFILYFTVNMIMFSKDITRTVVELFTNWLIVFAVLITVWFNNIHTKTDKNKKIISIIDDAFHNHINSSASVTALGIESYVEGEEDFMKQISKELEK